MVIKFASGVSDFEKLSERSDLCYIDKSLMVRDIFLETDAVILLPRPRRFGKTLNMSMLFNFLSNPDSRPWFEKLKINKYPEIMAELGQHPTIFLSFKDAKQKSYLDMLAYLAGVMSKLYEKFIFLFDHLTPNQKNYFTRILEKKGEGSELSQSLFSLSEWLSTYSKKLVWVVLDEYDAPIHAGWQYEYYSDIVSFMQSYLGAAFKDNSYLYRGVMTGILRVSRENIFSGLNNVSVYSMLSPKYGEYFGFTDPEIDLICELGEFKQERENMRAWYNGYQIQNIQLYNPWSIVKYVTERTLKPYWVNTSNNIIVKKLIAGAGSDIKKLFENLMQDQAVIVNIDEHCVLPGVEGDESEALWSFLLFSGYLKVMGVELVGTKARCLVAIPNLEIKYLYQDQLSKLFSPVFTNNNYLHMLGALTSGDVENFEYHLQNYLKTSMSYLDSGREEPERFYHGFVLGLLVSLEPTHQVISNREAGDGRYDLMIVPKDIKKLGIIMEFKACRLKNPSEQDLELQADKALAQIENNNYQAELAHRGIKNILKLGLVFYKKSLVIKSNKI